MGIAAGFALLSVLGLEQFGLDPAHGVVWGVMVAAMAVGVAVGLKSPLLAIVLVPELAGDYTLLLVIAVVVLAATVVDLGLDRVIRRFGPLVPDVVYDDDA
jgi:H+/Cl- antiporter ClcA